MKQTKVYSCAYVWVSLNGPSYTIDIRTSFTRLRAAALLDDTMHVVQKTRVGGGCHCCRSLLLTGMALLLLSSKSYSCTCNPEPLSMLFETSAAL